MISIFTILRAINLLITYTMVATLWGDGEYYNICYMDIKMVRTRAVAVKIS